MDTTDIDGNKMDSSIFAKNKVTLVNVWNVGCTPCVNEIPDLDKINSEYKDKGAAVYGLYGDLGMGISDDEMAQIKDIMSNANASYTQLRMDGTLATNESLLNIMAYPTTYVVGSDGTILDTIEGSKDYEGWKALIDSYLAE
jgi:thiol-disulfide isomerase/thioredoxin